MECIAAGGVWRIESMDRKAMMVRRSKERTLNAFPVKFGLLNTDASTKPAKGTSQGPYRLPLHPSVFSS